MAYVNTTNYQQEMVEREAESSTYTSLTQRSEDETTYSEIRPNERIQINSEPPRKEFMCNDSKLKLVLIIVFIISLAALLSSIVTTVLLKQNIDSILMDMKNEIQALKRNKSENVVSSNHQGITWSAWSSWGKCSVACNGGIRTRPRTCDGVGSCSGNNVDFSSCNSNVCEYSNNNTFIDGMWSVWGSWGSCSATCNGGMRDRHRSCNNPAPSLLGKTCIGNSQNTEICNNHNCPSPMVYFAVSNSNGTLTTRYNRPLFRAVVSNHGGGYNMETAVFTAPIKGLYQFSFTFYQISTSRIYCYLYHKSNEITFVNTGSNDHYATASISVYLYLDIGDTVDLRNCGRWQDVWKSNGSIFTGALIMPS